jgi:hypothetical protein
MSVADINEARMKRRYENYSIELDCPPGHPRPNDLIDGVLFGTGLSVHDFDTAPPFFGHQTWILREKANKDKLFIDAKPTFKLRIDILYKLNLIRYGSW